MRAYIDSDILIWHLRGKREAFKFLKELKSDAQYELWVGALQRAEVVFFMKPGEVEKTELFLSEFATAPVDRDIVDAAGSLYREWNPSHGVEVNDAILAATALKTGGKIYTCNIKHYPMPNLVVAKAF